LKNERKERLSSEEESLGREAGLLLRCRSRRDRGGDAALCGGDDGDGGGVARSTCAEYAEKWGVTAAARGGLSLSPAEPRPPPYTATSAAAAAVS
jgi:hypothetical protein